MSIVGKWNLTVSTPMGDMPSTLVLNADGTGTTSSQMGSSQLTDVKIDGDSASFQVKIDVMGQEMVLTGRATADGDAITGGYESTMGRSGFSGRRAT
jgi:hypothetical protein